MVFISCKHWCSYRVNAVHIVWVLVLILCKHWSSYIASSSVHVIWTLVFRNMSYEHLCSETIREQMCILLFGIFLFLSLYLCSLTGSSDWYSGFYQGTEKQNISQVSCILNCINHLWLKVLLIPFKQYSASTGICNEIEDIVPEIISKWLLFYNFFSNMKLRFLVLVWNMKL